MLLHPDWLDVYGDSLVYRCWSTLASQDKILEFLTMIIPVRLFERTGELHELSCLKGLM